MFKAAAAVAVFVVLALTASAGADGESLQMTQGSAFDGPVTSFVGGQVDSATIDWGDGTTSAGTVSGGRSGWTISGTHTYHTHGNFNIVVTTADNAGVTSTHTASATVAPASLSVTGSPVPAVQGEG
ncbi:MAG: hypothetical protein QOI61_2344, partial [Actinomycetota bacterium]